MQYDDPAGRLTPFEYECLIKHSCFLMNSRSNGGKTAEKGDEMSHTPGPWKVEIANMTSIMGPDDQTVALPCMPWRGADKDKTFEANARLIAAAPELLEALRAFVDFPADFFDRRDDESVVITILGAHLKEARAAIAKAEGNQ